MKFNLLIKIFLIVSSVLILSACANLMSEPIASEFENYNDTIIKQIQDDYANNKINIKSESYIKGIMMMYMLYYNNNTTSTLEHTKEMLSETNNKHKFSTLEVAIISIDFFNSSLADILYEDSNTSVKKTMIDYLGTWKVTGNRDETQDPATRKTTYYYEYYNQRLDKKAWFKFTSNDIDVANSIVDKYNDEYLKSYFYKSIYFNVLEKDFQEIKKKFSKNQDKPLKNFFNNFEDVQNFINRNEKTILTNLKIIAHNEELNDFIKHGGSNCAYYIDLGEFAMSKSNDFRQNCIYIARNMQVSQSIKEGILVRHSDVINYGLKNYFFETNLKLVDDQTVSGLIKYTGTYSYLSLLGQRTINKFKLLDVDFSDYSYIGFDNLQKETVDTKTIYK